MWDDVLGRFQQIFVQIQKVAYIIFLLWGSQIWNIRTSRDYPCDIPSTLPIFSKVSDLSCTGSILPHRPDACS